MTTLPAVPPAAADPQQFPDLSGYTDVNAKDYLTFSAYSTTGVQFVAPGGYRCLQTLSPHSKVTYERATCGVDQSVTACSLQGDQGSPHGFVLSPTGSRTF